MTAEQKLPRKETGGIRMNSITNTYMNLLDEFFAKRIQSNVNAIIFFQGFPDEFYQALSNNKVKHFCSQTFTSNISFSDIDNAKLVQHFITSTGCVWGFYEELIALATTLNDFSIGNKKVYVVNNNFFENYYPISVSYDLRALSKIYEDDSANIENEKIVLFYSGYKSVDNVSYFSYVNKHYPIDIVIDVDEIGFFETSSEQDPPENIWDKTIVTNHDLPLLKIALLKGNLSESAYVVKCLNNELSEEVKLLNAFAQYFKVHFELDNVAHEVDFRLSNRHVSVLKKYWGEDAEFYNRLFYKEPAYDNQTHELSQGLLISNIIEQCEAAMMPDNKKYSDIIVTAPTGAGKSLFFQIPAIYLHEKYKALTIVICPLVALMNDQIKELHEKGVGYATFINSEISYEERQERLDGIISGQYSIVYLSPELLLAYDIRTLIGDRRIGLLVVDEAHLVTSWGRDFRVDYWFLGDYLEKIRRGSYYRKNNDARAFPALCLTATAVYGGRDDVIEDLQRSLNLNCSAEHLYIGYVKRDNISFKINVPENRKRKSQKEEKVLLTCAQVDKSLSQKEKSIVYFPFVSQIDDVMNELNENHPAAKGLVEKYSGSGMRSLEKNDSYNNFRNSDALVMLATKAFGMGVNIPDVVNVYHYAPTGTLADYVQEIGRAARKLPNGYAITDYLYNDMNYAKTLWGLSGLRHYQIKAIMKKLYDLYQTKKSRNLIFSPDTFSYLFDANSIDMKVKSGLMLLSADLLEKFHFRVINVRPKNLLASHYIVVPFEVEREFMNEYGKYCTLMKDDNPRTTPAYGYKTEVVTKNSGHIYEIDLGKVWEVEFNELTFAQFKYHFFVGDLFSFGADKILPRIKLTINYEKGYDFCRDSLLKLVAALQKTFNDIHRAYGGKQFEFSAFSDAFHRHYDEKIKREYLLLLLDIFCYETTDIYEIPNEQWKFIERRKGETSGLRSDSVYCIRTAKHGYIENNIKRYLKMAAPNSDENDDLFVSYLSIPKKNGKYSEYQLVASLLELFGFATYDLIGGRNPQIFVRINDPLKLKRISESGQEYRNRILTNIDERHKRSAMLVDNFMTSDLDDASRWGIIENYFLGFDGLVDSQLGIKE